MPPANDNFADAQLLVGASGSVQGDNTGATNEEPDPLLAWWGQAGGANIWFKWVAPASGSLLLTVSPPDAGTPIGDAVFLLYKGTAFGSLEVLDGTEAADTWHLYYESLIVEGETYYIEVDGFGDQTAEPLDPSLAAQGAFTLAWEMPPTPIWTPPVVIISEHHDTDDDVVPPDDFTENLTALVDGDEGKWFVLASGTEPFRNHPLILGGPNEYAPSWQRVEHTSFATPPAASFYPPAGYHYAASDRIVRGSAAAAADAEAEFTFPTRLAEAIAADDVLALRWNTVVPFENREADLGHRSFVGIVLGGVSRVFNDMSGDPPLGFAQDDGAAPVMALGTGTAVATGTDGVPFRFYTSVAKGWPGLLLGIVAWNNADDPTFTAAEGWTLAGEHAPTGASYGVAIYYKRFEASDEAFAFEGTLSESVPWTAAIASFVMARPVTGAAEEPVDNPAQGICVALENDTHELDQVWTRFDDPDA